MMTSAPKSDSIVAAAGPAIQLAQSITFRPANRFSVMCGIPPHKGTDATVGDMRGQAWQARAGAVAFGMAKLILTGDVNLMNVTDPATPFTRVGEEFRIGVLIEQPHGERHLLDGKD